MTSQAKNKLILLAIILPFVAFFIYGRFFVDPWQLPKRNQGQILIPHIEFNALETRNADGSRFDQDDLRNQWSVLYIAAAECDTACKNALYYQIRQMRLTLGDDISRVRRVAVLTETPAPSLREFLDNEVAGMIEINAELDTLRRAMASIHVQPEGFPAPTTLTPQSPLGDIFLVSPDGQIFMRYPSHEDMESTLEEAENIRVDLKRTLKGSLMG